MSKTKMKKTKTQKLSFFPVFGHFSKLKMGPLNLIHAFMCWPKSVPLRKRVRERNKKRDNDTERAYDCPKRHANCGPSLPVSIPTLGESLVQVYVAQIAQIARAWLAQNPASSGAWSGARAATSSCKVGTESGAPFSIIFAARNCLIAPKTPKM